MNREAELKRLVELIGDFFKKESGIGFTQEFLGELADHLLDSGIFVLPCKAGDYIEWDNGIEPRLHRVEGFYYNTQEAFPLRYDLGIIQPIIEHHAIKRIVPREDAEKMLKGEGK